MIELGMRTLLTIILSTVYFAVAVCFAQQRLSDGRRNDLPVDFGEQMFTSSQEMEYLKEIASTLSIRVSDTDTSGDIAFKITQQLENVTRYRGDVFPEDAFLKAKSAIRIPADAKAFAEYHAIIKKVSGKTVIIVEDPDYN